eukprot:gnl/MRDRNA2_/MRDRNA2_100868_c0_seq1.p1 gnl/MRDRNA2_/MRDRNA2_100868_c0~~gnl/MRDRNA2_/MRDRNA2_100868_c0_seq1.p1  ORF type:complete len:328 (-),score=61.92 gnl/MRDRNA2_/MRDRNA2_100868_c0_seq1:90-1073(-)
MGAAQQKCCCKENIDSKGEIKDIPLKDEAVFPEPRLAVNDNSTTATNDKSLSGSKPPPGARDSFSNVAVDVSAIRKTYHATANRSLFNGYWTSASDGADMCFIKDGWLTWHVDHSIGQIIQLTVDDNGAVTISLEGEMHTAQLKDDMIVWSDGDKWQRHPRADQLVTYNGIWLQADGRALCEIDNGLLTWFLEHAQHAVRVNLTQGGDLKLDLGSDGCHTGKMSDDHDTIVWNDGDRWKRNPNAHMLSLYQGCWGSIAKGTEMCEIHDGILTWIGDHPPGDTKVTVDEKGRLLMFIDGSLFMATLDDNKVLWSDGDKWQRSASQGKL